MQIRNLGFFSTSFVFVLSGALVSGCASHKSTGDAPNPFATASTLKMDEASKGVATKMRLVTVSNINGETEPCGCAVNPKGGLDRSLNFIRSVNTDFPNAAGPLLILDAGNALFTNESIPPSHKNQQFEKARLILKAQALMGLKYQNVGHLDLSAGSAFLKDEAAKNKLTLLSANLADAKGQLLFTPSADVDLGQGTVVSVVGLTRGLERDDDAFKVLDAEAALKAILAKLPADRMVVVLSDLGTAQDREIFPKIDRSMIVVGARDLNSIETPEFMGRSLFIATQMQGQQWAVLDVAFKKDAKTWYDIGSGKRFVDSWQRRNDQIRDLTSEKASSDDLKEEIGRIESARKELLTYAPGDLNQKSVVDYKTVEMTVTFSKTNEITPLMAKAKKIK